MTKTFTPDDLLRYLYQDTSIEETVKIEKALQNDPCLRKEYEQLQQDVELLDELVLAPSESSVNHIMGYARTMNLNALCN